MTTNEKVKKFLEKLVGESVSIDCCQFNNLTIFNKGISLGYSQFNELLLLLGFDRITRSFFQFLVDQTIPFKYDSKISSIQQLENGVYEFRKIALLSYANVKHGFKILARDSEELTYLLETLAPYKKEHFTLRHSPILGIEQIPADETYLLGYKVKDRIDIGLKKTPDDQGLLQLLKKREKVLEKGKKNQIAYLASDHLDVYVATSMRLEHEFISVNKIISSLSNHIDLADFKLRWFNPTQAYCDDRIDKGLAEGLMLKRAKCTVYLAQESDTLGKDSELASTLAQGKPVIALVPKGDRDYVDEHLELLVNLNSGLERKFIILDQLKVFDPSLAWDQKPESKIIRYWVDHPEEIDESKLLEMLYQKVKKHYDDRYITLKESHPLGIQVDLETGVATGVLVVRDVDSCAKLVKTCVFKSMDFDIKSEIKESGEYIYLIEKISKSIYRVATGDPLLTNTFWNFYLDEPQEEANNFIEEISESDTNIK